MNRARIHILSWALLAWAFVVTAPPSVAAPPDSTGFGTVVVLATLDGHPEPYVNVIVLGTRIGATTGQNGSCRLERVPAGTKTVRVLRIYCDPASRAFFLGSGSEDTLRVELHMRCEWRDHATPDCLEPNPAERARAGQRCRVHPWVTLACDTVGIAYGLQVRTAERVAFEAMLPDSFPNAGRSPNRGCDIGRAMFTEVAYCSECRRAVERFWKRARKPRFW